MEYRMSEEFERLKARDKDACSECGSKNCPGRPGMKGICANKTEFPEIKLYAIRNSEGKWFRAKGYGGYGDSWVETFESLKVRLYPKIGTARTQVSFFANKYPQYPAPEIVEFTVKGARVIDETDRVAKAKAARDRKELAELERAKKRKVEEAEAEFQRARAKLYKAKKGL